MIDTLVNMLFRCPHRRLTRPLTPVNKAGVPRGDTHVVCLDCGKQFAYDLQEMRVGKPIEPSHEASVLPPHMPLARKRKLKYAFLASVPLGVVLGLVLRPKKSREQAKPGSVK